MNFYREDTMNLSPGGTSQIVAMSTTSAQSTVINAPYIVVYADAACYVRSGAGTGTVTALGTGVDQYIPLGAQYRFPWKEGDKLAAITLTGTGNLYITPGV